MAIEEIQISIGLDGAVLPSGSQHGPWVAGKLLRGGRAIIVYGSGRTPILAAQDAAMKSLSDPASYHPIIQVPDPDQYQREGVGQ